MAAAEPTAPLVEATHLTKRYGEFVAVDDLTFRVDGGEIYGLLGPNGAGKTTTILMLLGLSEPSDGEARVIGLDPATVDQIDPNTSAPATAHITPSSNAVAGDYQITLSASNADANESIDVRVTVETSPIWGIVGLLLVVATIGGLVLVFRRYGRR